MFGLQGSLRVICFILVSGFTTDRKVVQKYNNLKPKLTSFINIPNVLIGTLHDFTF
jgi:hypothetical protein